MSDFATEDIEITLREIFPDDVDTELFARAKLGGIRSAEHLCTVSVKFCSDHRCSWPEMMNDQVDVFRDLRMLPA